MYRPQESKSWNRQCIDHRRVNLDVIGVIDCSLTVSMFITLDLSVSHMFDFLYVSEYNSENLGSGL